MKDYFLFLCFVGVWREVRATESWQKSLRKLYVLLWLFHVAMLGMTAWGCCLVYKFWRML